MYIYIYIERERYKNDDAPAAWPVVVGAPLLVRPPDATTLYYTILHYTTLYYTTLYYDITYCNQA